MAVPFFITITVYSFTPSRIGIITARRMKSASGRTGSKLATVSGVIGVTGGAAVAAVESRRVRARAVRGLVMTAA